MKTGMQITEVIIPARRANVWAIGLFIFTGLTLGSIFIYISGLEILMAGIRSFFSNYLILVVVIISGMVVHELLHAIVFAVAASDWRSVRFGFNLKELAPYVHCPAVLSFTMFATVTLLPGVALGIIPLAVSLISGNAWLFIFSLFFTASAAGDFLCFSKMLAFPSTRMFKDHPDSIGFYVYEA